MNANELKEKISKLNIWKNGDVRAPHKPLLILYALGRLQGHKSKLLPYEEIRAKLIELLKEYGPRRKSYRPADPFVRLMNDGIWSLNVIPSTDNINDKWLLTNQVIGGFNEDVYALLVNNEDLIRDTAEMVLNEHFQETIHEDLLSAVGLNLEYIRRRPRDPEFRERILKAYEYSCAVCGFNVRLGRNLVAVEAAHIKWHQAGGPDVEENGIALCAMHHKLFNRGVFTINDSRELIVSDEAYGRGFEEWLNRFNGQQIHSPIHPDYQPNNLFVKWHVREVFKGQERYWVG